MTDADVATAAGPPDTWATPSLTRIWFHNGDAMWGARRLADRYAADPLLPLLDPHAIVDAATLSEDEIEDGLRALAGRVLRQEVFALDPAGMPGAHPISVRQHRHRLQRLQPAQGDAPAGFSATVLESVNWSYEQSPGDPRVSHEMTLARDDYGQATTQVAIGYARRSGQARTAAAQDRHWLQVEDAVIVNVDELDRFELGLITQSRAAELAGLRPGASGLFTVDQLGVAPVQAALAAPLSHEADLPDDPAQGAKARLLTLARKFYWDAAQGGALPAGQVGPVTLPHHDETACFSPGFIAGVLGTRVDDAALTGLGYVQKDGLWWQVEETRLFGPAAQFFQQTGVARSDGAQSRFVRDAYQMLLISVIDAMGNVSASEIDYNVLAPIRTTDPNGSLEEVGYDALGVIVASSRSGHVDAQPWGFAPPPAALPVRPATLAAALADPAGLIGGAASCSWYDLDAFARDGSPTAIVVFEREMLGMDGAGGGGAGPIGVGLSFLDGFGRVLQKKSLVGPGPAIQRDGVGHVVVDAGGEPVLAQVATRWRASGHTVYDAKQRPVRTYDPFFTGQPGFEGDAALQQLGNATLVAYDAVGRVVAQHFPNGTFTRATIGSWQIEQADQNDTVLDFDLADFPGVVARG